MWRLALLGLGGLALPAGLTLMLWSPATERQPAGVAPVAEPASASPAAPAEASRRTAQAAASRTATDAPPPAEPARAASPAAQAVSTGQPPRFDVVRVGARGSAVIAGRAAPGAEVLLLLDGQRELGRARADGRGEWVILPSEPLPAGAWELSLRSRLAGEETAGPDALVVVVPDQAPAQTAAREPERAGRDAASAEPEQAAGPIAVLIPPSATATPRILQGPQPAAAAPGRQGAAQLGMDSVDYEEGGTIRFAGTAPPGASVRVYVGDRHAGDAVADTAGRWMLAPEEQPPVGRNSLRVDQIGASGGVAARIEVPFQRDELPAGAFGSRRVVVQPGTNLWRIARAAYGRGTRFTVIYQTNREQIRDPHRIFPGQIFDLPEARAAN